MGDIGKEYLFIKDALCNKHLAYMERFGNASTRHAGNDVLAMSRILAKLKLLAKALVESDAVDEIEEITNSMSLKLSKKGIHHSVYLVNDGKNVIVWATGQNCTNSVDNIFISGTDDTGVYTKFHNILNPDFDWQAFAIFVLDTIHEIIYSRHDVIFESVLEDPPTLDKKL